MPLFVFIFFSFFLCVCTEAKDQQKIGIFTYKAKHIQPWDPESIKSGITGSEEAVIYIAQELAKLDYKVLVFGHPPKDSIHSLVHSNPRFIDIDFDEGDSVDIAISWRMPFIATRLKKRAQQVYLWPHDTYHATLTDEQINGFDDVLWTSQWQREQWISVNPGFARFDKIFGNGINPEQFKEVQERSNPYSCIYGSNYARGLEILLDIWPTIKEKFPRATLDIYYGWQHWGLLSPKKEAEMITQIHNYASLGVKDHGLVGHEELNRAYEQASFWTYPCIGLETFCITALRAQLSGAIPVIIQGSALKETVPHGYKCFEREKYLATLEQAMNNAEKIHLNDRQKMGEFILQEFTWKSQAKKWQQLFESQKIAPKI